MNYVDFYGHKISKLIVGDNPFTGHSYIPDFVPGSEMVEYCTDLYKEKKIQKLVDAFKLILEQCLTENTLIKDINKVFFFVFSVLIYYNSKPFGCTRQSRFCRESKSK